MDVAIDPICDMEVDTERPAGTSEYEGTTYYFCSTGCKRRFDSDPEQFAPRKPADEETA